MDYYFQDQLRWTWGFDNPNKTAALVVTVLPLLWIGYALAWRISKKFWRVAGTIFGGVALLLGWGLLMMTYSRGGVVAAVLAFGYVAWQRRQALPWKSMRVLVAGGLLLLIGGYGWLNGVAHRSTQWIGTHEGSVENRFELWKGSLAMIADIPQGVGTGNSGRFYTEWFQPLESTSRYRSLVNSYLTFAAEQGVAAFLGCALLFAVFWRVCRETSVSTQGSPVKIGLRASLIAFAVAGFFSTTMEEWKLWVVPVLVIIGLAGVACLAENPIGWKDAAVKGFFGVLLIFGPLWMVAGWLRHETATAISYQKRPTECVRVQPRQGASKTWQVAVDHSVLGDNEGKLLRRLALEKKISLVGGDSAVWNTQSDAILVVGSQVADLVGVEKIPCFLLAPAIMEEENAAKILREAKALRILLPDFDEDGRVDFWKEKIAEQSRDDVIVSTMEGVGTQVEWAWEAVMAELGEP